MNSICENFQDSISPESRIGIISVLRTQGAPEDEISEILELADHDPAKLKRLMIRKRFGEPNAYLRGHVSYFGREFKIDRRCYIPDAYAQELVERVLADATAGGRGLEVGTGCGWVSISLVSERPDLTMSASDIDTATLQLAQENASRHGVNITFFESNFADDVTITEPDFIIANVPYGGDAEYTDRELEERPQMPPIAICDPEGPTAPLVQLIESIQGRGWRCKVYLETGYLDADRLRPVTDICSSSEHVRNGDFGYLVLKL